jgi:sulfur transfer protein SufE
MLVFVFNKEYYLFYEISTAQFNELLKTNTKLQDLWKSFCEVTVFETTLLRLLDNQQLLPLYKKHLAKQEKAVSDAELNLFLDDLGKIKLEAQQT